MANSIQIPGYKVAIPNMWWRKDLRGGQQSMSVFLRMVKYAVPEKEQIVLCVKERAAGADYEKLRKIAMNEVLKTPVESALSVMPQEIFEEFKGGNPKMYGHLERHIDYGVEQPGRTYLDMDRWAVPTAVFEMAREFPDRTLPTEDDKFTSMMHKYGEKESDFLMLLEGHARLPEMERMKSLLEAQVKFSRKFSTNCDFDDYEALAREVRGIYEALGATGINGVHDISDVYLQVRGLGAVSNTWECMQKQMLVKGLVTQVIPGILSAMQQASPSGKKGKTPKPLNLDNLTCEN